MDQITSQKRRVQAFLASGRKKVWLAHKADVPPTTLTGCDGSDWNPRTDTLAKLVRVIDEIEAEDHQQLQDDIWTEGAGRGLSPKRDKKPSTTVRKQDTLTAAE